MADVIKKATRESYGEALAELSSVYPDLIVLDADLAAATKTGIFSRYRFHRQEGICKLLRNVCGRTCF